jgi:Leucine-rich repeat (LRR) protein
LVRLNASNNRIQAPLPKFSTLTALKELLLNFNNIKTLDASNLTASIVQLSLGDNSIATLPKEVAALSALQHLDLSNNDLNDGARNPYYSV